VGRDGRLCRAVAGSAGFTELAPENDLGVDGDLPENVWQTALWLSSARGALASPTRGQRRRTVARDVAVFGGPRGEVHQQHAGN
jgi:hypothetical protein